MGKNKIDDFDDFEIDDLDSDINSKIEDNKSLEPIDDPEYVDAEPIEDDQDEDDVWKADYDDDEGSSFDGGGGAPPIEKHVDLLKDLTNFAPYLKETVNGWLGLVWSQEEEKFIKHPELDAIMDFKCASWCVSFLKPYTRNNNILTHIGKDEYNWMNMDMSKAIWLNIGCRSEEFHIKTDGDIYRICIELEHAANLVLMGAGGGKYSDLLRTTVHRSENVNYQGTGGHPQDQMSMGNMVQMNKPKGFLGKLKNKLVGGQ